MSIIQNGLSGLQASQILLDTTSNNIANANTEGFSRQEGILVTRTSGKNPLSPGDGVEVSSLRRISDDYAESALWRATSQANYYNQMEAMYSQAEGIVGAVGLSVSEGIDNLFEAFNAAAADPQTIATRQQILGNADNLAKRFNQLTVNLDLQTTQITEQLDFKIKELNQKFESLASINKQIVEYKALKNSTAALEDQRNVMIKNLSEDLDITAQRHSDGRIDISLKSGEPLVLGTRSSTIGLTGTNLSVQLGAQTFNVQDAGSGLGALIEFRDTNLPAIRNSLNTQATDLADQINNQLVQGYDLNSNPGVPLFTYNPADPAGSLAITNITPEELAFIDDNAGTPAGGPGDNGNLLKIIDLKSNFYDSYTDLVSDLAINTSRVGAEAQANQALMNSAEAKRDNISGVNRDEEAANLVAFTQSYQANAKVITLAGDLFNSVMGIFR